MLEILIEDQIVLINAIVSSPLQTVNNGKNGPWLNIHELCITCQIQKYSCLFLNIQHKYER